VQQAQFSSPPSQRAIEPGLALCSPSTFRLRRLAEVLRAGGVIAYPTEGVFGLGCDPRNETALRRILHIKGRTESKGLILIGTSEEQLWEYASEVDAARMTQVRGTWPGPVTWIFPARAELSALITGGRTTVAVRVTSHPGAAALCKAFGGALISTSANISGAAPARRRLQVQRMLGAHIDAIAPGRVGERRGPSEIFDASSAQMLRGNARGE
jgi:L-threonylcarbamoyladenylate synthase